MGNAAMPLPGPMLLNPRFDPKPWGGRRLADFGFVLPPGGPVGEAVITAADATVANGLHAGRTLGDVVGDDPRSAIGELGLAVTGGRPIFPLLIKVIDAAADLSIQVHPTDVTALGGGLGKTEAWHVLHADPGASLYLGLRADVTIWELQRLARAGASTAGLLNKVPAHIGTTYLLPAGTVHALGAGVVVYEIQQPSAITYRLDDWGRVDSLGRPRDLHLDEAFAVIDAESRPEPLPPAPLPRSPGRRTTLVSCAYFAAERIELGPGDKIRLEAPGSPQTVTCLSGSADVRADGASVILASGQTAALLASAASATLTARTTAVLLRGWAPTERPILIAMPKS